MRIYFINPSILTKNAKRIKRILKEVYINDLSYNQNKDKIALTTVKNLLSMAYGYNNYIELKQSPSQDKPQLVDLTNDEEILIEKNVTGVFDAYFVSIGIQSEVALSVAQGLSNTLRFHSTKTKSNLTYPVKYGAYKKLAHEYSMTIPAFKRVLTVNKMLNGTFPTRSAIKTEKAKVRIIGSDMYGANLKVEWSEKYIKNAFKRKGIEVASKYKRLELPTSIYKANDNLEKFAEYLYEIIMEAEETNTEAGEHWEWPWVDIDCHMLLHLTEYEPRDKRRPVIMEHFNASIKRAGEINKSEADLIAIHLGNLITWIEDY